jgi:hypothetical protein
MTARLSLLPDPEPGAPPTFPNAAKVAGWGVVLWGAVELASAFLDRYATAGLGVQAILAVWGAGWLGIPWSDPHAPPPRTAQILTRVGRGAVCGGGAAALVVALAVAGGAAVRPAPPASMGLAVGLLIAALGAMRDELLLRGVVLGVTRGLVPAWGALAACAAVAAAARFGLSAGEGGGAWGWRALGVALAVDALRGVALGALWLRDRGAWMACAASAVWAWTLDNLARGGLVDVRFPVEPSSSMPALLAVAAAAAAACVWALRATSAGRMEAKGPGGLR